MMDDYLASDAPGSLLSRLRHLVNDGTITSIELDFLRSEWRRVHRS